MILYGFNLPLKHIHVTGTGINYSHFTLLTPTLTLSSKNRTYSRPSVPSGSPRSLVMSKVERRMRGRSLKVKHRPMSLPEKPTAQGPGEKELGTCCRHLEGKYGGV